MQHSPLIAWILDTMILDTRIWILENKVRILKMDARMQHSPLIAWIPDTRILDARTRTLDTRILDARTRILDTRILRLGRPEADLGEAGGRLIGGVRGGGDPR